MKTNTTKLRRALTAFAMTGAMLAVSELNAETLDTVTGTLSGDVTFTDGDTTVSNRPISVNNANITFSGTGTINSNDGRLFSGTGTNTLNAGNMTFTNGGIENNSATFHGGLITGGNWDITGGIFTENTTSNPNTTMTDNVSYGGAVYGDTISLNNVVFTSNSSGSGVTTGSSWSRSNSWGGAVMGNYSVTIVGNSQFLNNITASGDIGNGKSPAIGGAVASGKDITNSTVVISIGEDKTKDNIVFSGNTADSNRGTTGGEGAHGGALGTNTGSILISAEDGDSIRFTGNNAVSSYNKAQGGAIATARTNNGSTVTINASENAEVLFDGNTVVQEHGVRAHGGAIYVRAGSDAISTFNNVDFSNNYVEMKTATVDTSIWTTLGEDLKGSGGAIFMHKPGTFNISNSDFTNNRVVNTGEETPVAGSQLYGGAIASAEGNIVLSGTNTFAGNYISSKMVDGYGGAMAIENGEDGTISISGTNNFTNNSVKSENGSAYGGAIFGQDIEFDANSTSVFDGNSVTGGYYALGGAIAGIGDITISGKNTFKNNTASGHVSNGGAIYSADSLTLTGSSLFENNSVISSYSAIGGAICTENGFSISGAVFNNNSADLGGAIATGAGGKHTVKISNSTFANNNAKQGGAIECMNVQDNDVILQISDSIFNGNRAGESGGVAVVSRGVFSLSGTNEFVGNTAKKLGGVFSSYGAFDVDDTITGNNLFANNSAQSGGAIYSGNDLVFSDDDSKAVFTGNTADGKPNDIFSTKSVTIQDAGTYSFDGGIVAETMGINGSDVTFKEGSITDINGEVTLENATLNIETDGTEKTKFEVGSITDKGGNTLNIDYSGTENGTVISGDTTGLKTRPEVEYTALQDGEYGYVSSSTNKGMNVTVSETDKTYARLSTNGETAWADSATADNLADLGTVGTNDEIVVTAAPTAKTAGLTANGALSFRSNNTTARTIESDGSTLVSGASDLTLNNVTLKSNSSENAVVKGDSVNLTGKGTAGISAPKAIESTNGVTLDGKLTVDGAITGNTTIADGADVTVTQRTDVTDDLKVGTGATLTLSDIAMTFEEVKDANGNTVVDENGKSVKTPVVDAIEIGGDIAFEKDAVIEISFDETFNLDAPGTYEIMKGDSLTNGGAEFSFVDAIAEMDGMQMLEVSIAQNGALMLDVKGFGTVPEPSTWALLVLGGLGVFGVARKNRKAKK